MSNLLTTSQSPSPNLEGLPRELVWLIAGFLSEASVAILALCSKKLLKTIGSEPFKITKSRAPSTKSVLRAPFLQDDLKGTYSEFYIFLELLSKFDLDRIVCHWCRKLHEPEKANPEYIAADLSTRYFARECSLLHFKSTLITLHMKSRGDTPTNFCFAKVQNVMKHHRLKLDCTAYLKDLSPQWSNDTNNIQDYQNYQRSLGLNLGPEHYIFSATYHSRSAKIVSENLIIRTEHRFPLRIDTEYPTLPEYWNIELCTHLMASSNPKQSTRVLSPVGLFIRAIQKKVFIWGACSGLMRCDYCPCEFEIAPVEHDNQNYLIFRTWYEPFPSFS